MVDDASDNETYVMTLLTKDGLIVSNRCHIGVGALSWPRQIEKEVVALQIVNLIKVNDDIYIDMATYIIKRSWCFDQEDIILCFYGYFCYAYVNITVGVLLLLT